MDQNFSEIQYDVTKKTKLRKFYDSNKKLIYLLLTLIIIFIGSFSFYLDNNERKRILLSDNYIKSKIYLENGEKNKAKDILKEIIYGNDDTYSALSLFLLLNENLITDHKELLNLFDHVLKNTQFQDELKNLLIYKKALFQSNFASETELLEVVKPLISRSSLWKPHALLLMGDYFASKNEYSKAKEFYMQILSIKNLHQDFHKQARNKLSLVTND